MSESKEHNLLMLSARFDDWLQAINYSPKTRVNYGRDVRLFRRLPPRTNEWPDGPLVQLTYVLRDQQDQLE